MDIYQESETNINNYTKELFSIIRENIDNYCLTRSKFGFAQMRIFFILPNESISSSEDFLSQVFKSNEERENIKKLMYIYLKDKKEITINWDENHYPNDLIITILNKIDNLDFLKKQESEPCFRDILRAKLGASKNIYSDDYQIEKYVREIKNYCMDRTNGGYDFAQIMVSDRDFDFNPPEMGKNFFRLPKRVNDNAILHDIMEALQLEKLEVTTDNYTLYTIWW